jgi:hypothetical protein
MTERFVTYIHTFCSSPTFNSVTTTGVRLQQHIEPRDTVCPICRAVILKASLRRHQRSLLCETAKLRHEMEKKGLVVTDDRTSTLLKVAGVKVQSKPTRYMNNGRYVRAWYVDWVTRAENSIGLWVRGRCPALNKNRAKVVRDLLDNVSARVSIELGADPIPFVEEAAKRLGVRFWDGKEPAEDLGEEEP